MDGGNYLKVLNSLLLIREEEDQDADTENKAESKGKKKTKRKQGSVHLIIIIVFGIVADKINISTHTRWMIFSTYSSILSHQGRQ